MVCGSPRYLTMSAPIAMVTAGSPCAWLRRNGRQFVVRFPGWLCAETAVRGLRIVLVAPLVKVYGAPCQGDERDNPPGLVGATVVDQGEDEHPGAKHQE